MLSSSPVKPTTRHPVFSLCIVPYLFGAVSLVAILDADKEGFLRNDTSLIQTCGRAARNVEGKVIMYADNITKSMKSAIAETERRREKQIDVGTKNLSD